MTLRRTPLRRTAQLRAKPRDPDEVRRRQRVRAEVFARDGHRCVLAGHPDHPRGGCWGPLEAHHLRKESQGGPYVERNLVTVCWFLNRWVEDNPDRAHALGLVVRRGEHVSGAWRRLRAAQHHR